MESKEPCNTGEIGSLQETGETGEGVFGRQQGLANNTTRHHSPLSDQSASAIHTIMPPFEKPVR